jgi:hypothetical protein
MGKEGKEKRIIKHQQYHKTPPVKAEDMRKLISTAFNKAVDE